jgi:hypothetical protein
VVRGSLLAGTSAVLAVAAHVIGGGMAPATGLTVLLTIGIAAAGIALADRQRGWVEILLALGAAQLGMHVLLTIGGHAGDAGQVHGWPMTGGHVLAVLLAAAVLAWAETAVFAVAAAVALLLPRRLAAPPTVDSPVLPRPPREPVDRAREVLLRRCLPRRGPPAFCR